MDTEEFEDDIVASTLGVKEVDMEYTVELDDAYSEEYYTVVRRNKDVDVPVGVNLDVYYTVRFFSDNSLKCEYPCEQKVKDFFVCGVEGTELCGNEGCVVDIIVSYNLGYYFGVVVLPLILMAILLTLFVVYGRFVYVNREKLFAKNAKFTQLDEDQSVPMEPVPPIEEDMPDTY